MVEMVRFFTGKGRSRPKRLVEIALHCRLCRECVWGAWDGYDPAAFDVWSSGVILFFMVAGDVVFAKLGGQICFRFLELIVTKRKFGDFLSPPGEIDTVGTHTLDVGVGVVQSVLQWIHVIRS
eukprot:m.524985 g.524985  ORF g.524985 m.524985 type:complete len:123 (-) comp21997_c0_seq2:244-612(-)